MAEVASHAVWQIFPARHGIVLKGDAAPCAANLSSHEQLASGNASCVRFLQRNDNSDDGNSELALPFSLSEQELLELQDVRLAAATHYGPTDQEKASNEDFALSAVIQAQGREFAFAAVADGVSTRTFWSARTARIACIGAYKGVRECLLDRIDPGDETKHTDIAWHVAAIVDQALSDDRAALESGNTIPSGWDKAVHEKHKGDLSAWHRSTLLFGVIGDNGGMIGMTGDGGVRGLLLEDANAREPVELRVMFSEMGRDLTSYVTQGFSSKDIQLLPLRSRERLATHVVFTSDGLDLTLQQYAPNEVHDKGRDCRSRYRDLPLNSGQTALNFLEMLSKAPRTVPDNLSVARLTWPLPKKRARWARWKTEKFERWKFSEPSVEKSEIKNQEATGFSWSGLAPGKLIQWIVPALIGLAVGCVITSASIATFIGFEKLKADLSPAATAVKFVTPQQTAGPNVSSKEAVDVKEIPIPLPDLEQ